jgi:molybdopterin molybdotransferase
VPDALARWLAPLRPVPVQRLALADAAGLVLAEPLMAPAALPPQTVALRSGFAVAAADTVGASAYSPAFLPDVPERIRAGSLLPAGTDAVLPADAVTLLGGLAQVSQAVIPGENARRPGEDASQGAVLRPAGRHLRPLDLAIGTAAQVEQCSVRRATVRLLAAQVHDAAVRLLVTAMLEAGGATVEVSAPSGSCPDLVGALEEADADLVVVLGASGPDPADHGPAALAEAGDLVAAGLALRPGEAGGCGHAGGRPVLLIPDRLEAALAMMLVFARPCLDLLQGAAPAPAMPPAPLLRRITSTVGLTDIVLLRRIAAGLEPLATAELSLPAIASADAWMAIPPTSEGMAPGTIIEVQPFPMCA